MVVQLFVALCFNQKFNTVDIIYLVLFKLTEKFYIYIWYCGDLSEI